MSIDLINKAFKVKVGSHIKKLILIKLADNANDQGECWPSYKHIAEQCEMSRVTVIQHIEDFVFAGYIEKQLRKLHNLDVNSSNIYLLTLDKGVPELLLQSEKNRAVKRKSKENMTVGGSPGELGGIRCELGEGGLRGEPRSSPGVLGVVNAVNPEPSVESSSNHHDLKDSDHSANYWDQVCPKRGKKNRSDALSLLDWSSWPSLPSIEVMQAYLKACRSKSEMTQLVVNSVGAELQKLAPYGIGVDAALKEAIVPGWQGFKFEWVARNLNLPIAQSFRARQDKFNPFQAHKQDVDQRRLMMEHDDFMQSDQGAIDGEFDQIG